MTFTQQLQKLQARGLVVPDKPRALCSLAKISYCRLSDYWGSFLSFGTSYFDSGLSLACHSELSLPTGETTPDILANRGRFKTS